MNRERNFERNEASNLGGEMIREGHLVLDEEIVRGDGPVTYVGTVGTEGSTSSERRWGSLTQVERGTSLTAAGASEPAFTAPIPSMTADKTDTALETTGSMMADSAASRVINRVREGMRVVDAAGEELGNIDYVKMGDPGAATVGVDRPAEPGLIDGLFGTDPEPDVPEPLRSRLLRFGFVKIDGQGWIDTDRYVTSDLIGAVSGDTVRLTARKDAILTDEV